MSTVVKAFAGYEFVGLALDDDCCVAERKSAGNDQFASVVHCSLVTVGVELTAVKAFVGCECDFAVHGSGGCYAANEAPL